MQSGLFVSLLFPLDAQDYFALLRELNRIAYKIYDDLSQTAGIANQVLRHVHVYMDRQFQAFLMGPEAKRSHDFVDVREIRFSVVQRLLILVPKSIRIRCLRVE